MRYVSFVCLMALCLFAACPAGPIVPEGSQSESKDEQQTTKDSGTADTVATDQGTPDPGQPDTPTKDEGTPKDDAKPDPGQPEPRQEPVAEPVTDSAIEPIDDSAMEPASDDVLDASADTAPDAAPDVVADTEPDAVADTSSEATPEGTSEGTPDINGLTCTERADKSNAEVDGVRQQNLGCAITTECTTVSVATSCQGACPAPVNTAGKAKVDAAVANVNQTYCLNYQQDGCPYATPKCVATNVVCNQNVCANMSCTDRRDAARTRVNDVRNANLTCTNDSDCVLVFHGTNCAGACQVAVNKQGETLLKAEIADINQTICFNYQGDMCPYATPSCIAAVAKCNAGTCTAAQPQP